MKGIVFTEFLDFVEDNHSADLVDELIESADLPTGGSYTSVGTYEASEMVTLVSRLSVLTDTPVPQLLRAFGSHLFGRFTVLFPSFFENMNSSLDFLPSVHNFVHLEVQKLYPDAELPEFTCETPEPGVLKMEYKSSRDLPDFAEGLLRGCVAHFNNDAEVSRLTLDGDPQRVMFMISNRN